MARPEIEGDWVMGWPDRKRPAIIAGKDSQGRVINGRAPITQLEGLITPTDAYYVVNQLEVPDPVHPDDWILSIGGEVEKPIEVSLKDRTITTPEASYGFEHAQLRQCPVFQVTANSRLRHIDSSLHQS